MGVWSGGMRVEIVEKSGRKPEEYAMHSLRMGSASMLAAGGDVSE